MSERPLIMPADPGVRDGAARPRRLSFLLRPSPGRMPYLLLGPFIVLFVVFGLFPLLFSLYLAFQSWDPTGGMKAMQYVGWSNFSFALQDEWFWKSLKNTVWIALASGIPQHLVAIPLACFIHGCFGRLRNGVAGIYFMPYITSSVAIGILFSAFFSTDYGLVNLGIRLLHKLPLVGGLLPDEAVDWLNYPDAIKPAISLIVFWRYVGFNLVLYLAALQTIPPDLYEAARMDGAGWLQQFRHITLPSLKPMIFFGVTLSVIGGLQLFEEPMVLLVGGTGGPDQAGMTTAMYLYRMAFDFNDFGAASAMSWLMLVVVGVLTWVINRAFSERRERNAGERP